MKLAIVFFIVGIYVCSCGTTRGKHDIDTVSIKNINRHGAISRIEGIDSVRVMEDVTEILIIKGITDSTESLSQVGRQLMLTIRENSASVGGEKITSILSSKAIELEEKWNNLDPNISTIRSQQNELIKVLNSEYLGRRKLEILEEELEKFDSKNGGYEMSDEELEGVVIETEKRYADELRSIEQELRKLNMELKVLVQDQNTLIYETHILESNTMLTKMLLGIVRYSQFNTGEFSLSSEVSQEIENVCWVFIDSLYERINDAQEIMESLSLKQKFVLHVFIDGYSDSEKFTNATKSESDEKNNALSEKRAKEIRKLVSNAFEQKKDIFERIGFEVSKIEYSTNWHGTDKPNMNIDFEKEGFPDVNRRLVIVQGLFFPIE